MIKQPILPTAYTSTPTASPPELPSPPSHLPATPKRLITSTIILLGLQLAWAVELAYGTPYLLSLGMDKTFTSLVWLAGPISGLLVHPIIGAMSDNCSLRMGRRRPFLIIGTIGSIGSMGLVALSRPLGGSPMEDPTDKGTHVRATQLTICIAVFGFYILDFCINTVQAASRALIVDVMAPEDQALANGIAGIMICFGNVVGYAAGLIDWPSAVGIQGTPAAQFQLVCSVASMIFAACTACTVLFTNEVPLPSTYRLSTQNYGLVHTLTQPFINVQRALPNLPPTAISVCKIQLVAWIGWFPFLFYATTYVAQFTSNSHHPFDGPDAAHATRQGSLAFFAFSIVSLVIAVFLPWATKRWLMSLSLVWMVGEFSFAAVMMLGTFMVHSGQGASTVVALCGMAWAIGTWVPMALLGKALASHPQLTSRYAPLGRTDEYEGTGPQGSTEQFVSSESSLSDNEVMYVAADVGAVNKRKQHGSESRRPTNQLRSGYASQGTQRRRDLATSSSNFQASIPMDLDDRSPTQGKGACYAQSIGRARGRRLSRQSLASSSQPLPSAGVVLGLHNVSVVIPQLLVSVFAAGMFAILPDGHDLPMVSGAASDSIGWLFRVGGLAAAFSIFLIHHLLLRHE